MVYITFETDGKFMVVAGPKDMVLTELYEYQDVVGQLVFKESSYQQVTLLNKFIYIPYYQDYKKQFHENEYVLTTLELDKAAAKVLEDNNIDLQAYIGPT